MRSREIPIPSPELLARLVSENPPALWLDSALSGHPRGRYSILAMDPLASLDISPEGRGILRTRVEERSIETPLDFLDQWLRTHQEPEFGLPGFSGGWVGFFTYEAWMSGLRLSPGIARAPLPTGLFFLVDTALVIDHQEERARVFSLGLKDGLTDFDTRLGERRVEDLLGRFEGKGARPRRKLVLHSLSSNLTAETYLEKVREIREAIFRGDCYQVNLSQKFSATGQWDPAEFYLRLRESSPAPQMAFINLGNVQILSASPEVLLEMEGELARSFPIKGTRPRGGDEGSDRMRAEELLTSPKDHAELLMIVDLVRNDLGRFCLPGTIRVPRLRALETFRRVHHLVATVEGRTRPGVGPFRALSALSPGGSITGAPKLKAIEIIHALETVPRGIFTGSIGFADRAGRACFNIAIRTAFLRGGTLEYSVGGGIVADSDPRGEYEETLDKARGFFEAIGTSGPRL